jgi:hypothetical protein
MKTILAIALLASLCFNYYQSTVTTEDMTGDKIYGQLEHEALKQCDARANGTWAKEYGGQ